MGSKDNVIDQKSADNSKFKTSLVLSSNNQNALLLDKKLVESQKTNTVKNGDQKSANAVKLNTSTTPQWLPASLSLYSVKNDNTNKWRYNSNIKTWSYIKSDGTDANQEWLKDKDNQWYYFDKNGNMASNGWFATTSTQEDNGKKYYFNDDGVMVTNGWHDTLTEGVWKKYYFDGNGHYLNIHWRYDYDRNGQPIANRWIYDPNNHIWSYTKNDKKQAREEWVKASDGRWYYFNDGGVMVANGWHNTQLKDGKWKKYYFDKGGHYLIDHWAYDSNGKTWSYAKHDGTQANEEWLKMSDGHWYYFNIIGIMPTNSFLGTNLGNGKWQTYYFDKDGHYLTNAWAYDAYDKIWSYAKKDGTLATNEWLKLSDDQWYYFTNAEVMAMNGWYSTSHQNEKIKLYYFRKLQ